MRVCVCACLRACCRARLSATKGPPERPCRGVLGAPRATKGLLEQTVMGALQTCRLDLGVLPLLHEPLQAEQLACELSLCRLT